MIETMVQDQQGQTSIKINGAGIVGFILALLAGIFYWVPVLSWILWFLGYIFLWIGVYQKPRVIAIIGLTLSYTELMLVILVMTGLANGLELFLASLGVWGGFLITLVTVASVLGFFVAFWISSIMRSLKNIENYYITNGCSKSNGVVSDDMR